MHDDLFDPIYKGCTSTSTILGVPLLPFTLGALVIGQLSVLSFYFFNLSLALVFLSFGIFLHLLARKIGSNDEHRLLQHLMRFRIRAQTSGTRKFWGAVSFSPLPPRK